MAGNDLFDLLIMIDAIQASTPIVEVEAPLVQFSKVPLLIAGASGKIFFTDF